LAADFTAKVLGVLDAIPSKSCTTITLNESRLNGIDCPEKGQAYGTKAKQTASALIFGNDITLETHGKDKYGRTIADVLARRSINNWSRKDGVGGIRNTHQKTLQCAVGATGEAPKEWLVG
jgi:endonuclease YncB( thermonuclease family)